MGIVKPFKNYKRLSDELFYHFINIYFDVESPVLPKSIFRLIHEQSSTYTGLICLNLDEIHKLLKNKYSHNEIRIFLNLLIKEGLIHVVNKKFLGVNYTKLRMFLREQIPEGMLTLDNELSYLGFTQANFTHDSYLWRENNEIWISLIGTLREKKGKFRHLVTTLNQQLGFDIIVPTPLGRMKDIVAKNGYQQKSLLIDKEQRLEAWFWKSKLKLN